MPTETKNHVVPSIVDDDGNRQIIYARNTFDDVVVSDLDDTEDIGGHVHYYCVCDTAADVAAKEITVGNGDSTGLVKKGASFIVTFTNGNTATGATLSVNGGTAYSLIDVTESSISAAQTVTLLFDGTNFITGAGSGGTKVEESPVDPDEGEGTTKYVAMVDGSSDNSSISYDPSYYADSDGLHGKVGATTVDFTDDAADANTDYRTSAALETGNSLSSLFQKVKKIFAGMGALAFKSSVGTTELDATLSDAYTNRLSKSDLYNGTDYSGGAGNKALDASVGVTLQNSITSLNSKVTSHDSSISSINSEIADFGEYKVTSTSASNCNSLIRSGRYMGSNMTNAPSASWYIIDVFRHNDIYTVQVAYSFTSSTCPVYIRTQTNGTWNAWRLFNPGTANTAQVLTGYTFSSANGTNLSGTMANRGNLNWSPSSAASYTVPSGYYSGGTLNSANAYNAGLSAGRQNNGYVAFWYWGGGLEVGNSGGSQCILGYINSNLAIQSGNAIVFRYAGTYTMYWTFTSSDGSSSLHRIYNGASAQLYANGNWYEFAASGTNISVGANSSLYFTVNNGGKLGVSISVYRH